jgi:hypothetical protein
VDGQRGRGGQSRGGNKEAHAALTGRARQSVYQAHRDLENPNLFFLYEQYVDEDGYKAHGDSEHFQEYGFGTAIPLLESRGREFYVTLD